MRTFAARDRSVRISGVVQPRGPDLIRGWAQPRDGPGTCRGGGRAFVAPDGLAVKSAA